MEHQNSIPSVTITTSESSDALMTVDPFLVEALQNPRHRLTILRMELDIQKFIQNSEKQQFEFQHFPTSYLRLAAHRVAQHYGLQTMVLDNFSDGQGARILVKRLSETKQHAVCLSDVPTKFSENDKHKHTKIVLKPRPKLSSDGTNVGKKSNLVRTVEERKEDYDRARARIFSPQSDGAPLRTNSDGKSLGNSSGDENEGLNNSIIDGNTSRVAILRDREKDLTDPDYDRSYDRYMRNLPASQGFNLLPLTLPKFQPQYDPVIPHLGQHSNGQSQTPVGYRSSGISPYSVAGMNHLSGDAVYMQWPTHSMMYAHTYDQFRHAVIQVLMCKMSEKRALFKKARAHERIGKQKTKMSIEVIMIRKLMGCENKLWIGSIARVEENMGGKVYDITMFDRTQLRYNLYLEFEHNHVTYEHNRVQPRVGFYI